jgi:hypothetical protein
MLLISSIAQSCIRLKLITRQVITELTGATLDIEKIQKLIPKESGIYFPLDYCVLFIFVHDCTGLTWSDVKASIAAIAFVLTAATRWDVQAEVCIVGCY